MFASDDDDVDDDDDDDDDDKAASPLVPGAAHISPLTKQPRL